FVSVVREGLEAADFKVVVTYDGLQGLMQAHQNQPDVILLDFSMPAGGGNGVYERLRNSTDTSRIPVVFLTASPMEEVTGRIRPGPKTYFIKKPVSLGQIKTILNQVLGLSLPTA